MTRFTFIFMLAMVFAAASPSSAFAADPADPLLGTWQLDVHKSTFDPAPGPKGQLRTYARSGDAEKLTAQGISAEGKPTLVEYTARYDGKDYEIAGSSGGDQISLKRIDARTTESTQKRAGKAAIITTRTVSEDGKTLTVTTKGTNAQGVTLNNQMVFDRRR
ncbi:MAG: hypothetical protein ABI885_21030 [Gammaproteobacteria bacterium]